MPHHLPNLPLALQLPERVPGHRAINLHPVDEGGYRDEAVRLDVLVEALDGGLVEDDGVVRLVFHFAFGPFLFLFGGLGWWRLGGCVFVRLGSWGMYHVGLLVVGLERW